MKPAVARLALWLASLGLALPAAADDVVIRLPNRSIERPPGIETKLEDQLANAGLQEPVQAVVQLLQAPSAEDIGALRHAGVTLRTHVGGTAYLATVRPGADLAAVDRIRWAGLVLPHDKISTELWTLAESRPADAPLPMIAVHFHALAREAEVRDVIGRYSTIEQRYGPRSTWALHIRRGALEPLAMEPSVRWVERISDDALPLPAP